MVLGGAHGARGAPVMRARRRCARRVGALRDPAGRKAPSALSEDSAPIGPPWVSHGSRRSYTLQRAASAAWKRAVASAARLGSLPRRRVLPLAQQVLQERAFLEAEPEAAAALARLLRLKRLEQRLRKASTAGSAAAPPPPRGKPGKSPRRTWAQDMALTLGKNPEWDGRPVPFA